MLNKHIISIINIIIIASDITNFSLFIIFSPEVLYVPQYSNSIFILFDKPICLLKKLLLSTTSLLLERHFQTSYLFIYKIPEGKDAQKFIFQRINLSSDDFYYC